MEDPQEPRVTFWCQKCDDYPIVEGEEYGGYKIEGIIFSYLERKKQRKDEKDENGGD